MGVGNTIETSHNVCINIVQIWRTNKGITVKRNRNIFTHKVNWAEKYHRCLRQPSTKKNVFLPRNMGQLWGFCGNFETAIILRCLSDLKPSGWPPLGQNFWHQKYNKNWISQTEKCTYNIWNQQRWNEINNLTLEITLKVEINNKWLTRS